MIHKFTKGDIVGIPMHYLNSYNQKLYDPYKAHPKKLYQFDIFIVERCDRHHTVVRSIRLNDILFSVSLSELVLLTPVDIAGFKRCCKNLTENTKALMELGSPLGPVSEDRQRQLAGISNNKQNQENTVHYTCPTSLI